MLLGDMIESELSDSH